MEEARWGRLAIALRTRLGPPTGRARPCPQDLAGQPRLRRPPPRRRSAANRNRSIAFAMPATPANTARGPSRADRASPLQSEGAVPDDF
jgi:hypothetical protein